MKKACNWFLLGDILDKTNLVIFLSCTKSKKDLKVVENSRLVRIEKFFRKSSFFNMDFQIEKYKFSRMATLMTYDDLKN